MKLLMIDDIPYEENKGRIGNIKDAVREAGEEMNMEKDFQYITNNNEDTIRKNLSGCDLIILDWEFPDGHPTGEDTLKLIRNLEYQGPILIYTVGFGVYHKYLGRNGANGFHQEAWGKESLVGKIKSLLSNKDKIPTIKRRIWPYYKDIAAMEKHFYHPLSTCSESKEEERKVAMGQVCMVTTEWTGNGTNGNDMGKVIEIIEKVAGDDVEVIIRGETGTGKELIAKLLHYHHSNKGKRHGFKKSEEREWFMALNCGTFRKEAGNSELFGSLPGAFTDAEEKAGIFEQVTNYKDGKAINGGTVFLDEITLMENPCQSSFLRVLQEKYVYRMGHNLAEAYGGKYVKTKDGLEIERYKYGCIPVKFRLVSATNEDLVKKVNEGEFRVDLLFRIGKIFINLPSLRYRSPEDFNLLFQYFLHRYNDKNERSVKLSHKGDELVGPSSDLVEELLTTFPWVGNVRELENVVNSIAALSGDSNFPLSSEDIPEDFRVVAWGLGQ
jgi:DNA-binding NtrC family response regulator